MASSSLQALSLGLESLPPPAKLPPRETVELLAQARGMASGSSRLLPTLAHVQALVELVDAQAKALTRTESSVRSLKAANDELHVALAVVAYPEIAQETELRGRES